MNSRSFAICLLILGMLSYFPVLAHSQPLDELLDSKNPTGNEPEVTKSPSSQPSSIVLSSTADASSQNVDSVRKKIVSLAEAEVGLVDERNNGDGFKKGWQHLVSYYESAYKMSNLEKEQPSWYQQLKAPGKRIKNGPAHWCGIFCVWAWRSAGLPVYWNTKVIGCKYQGKMSNIQMGDICIIKKQYNANNHHCLVKSRDGNSLVTIDGNQSYQGISINKRTVDQIEIFYSVADAMGAAGVTTPPGNTPPHTTTPAVKPPSGSTPPSGGNTGGVGSQTVTPSGNNPPAGQNTNPLSPSPSRIEGIIKAFLKIFGFHF
ncbi:MAG: hypothetical protein WA705_14240 [Candidatus Ozemobacteraceae bacterium]